MHISSWEDTAPKANITSTRVEEAREHCGWFGSAVDHCCRRLTVYTLAQFPTQASVLANKSDV